VLFTTAVFVLLFLPVAFAGFFLIARVSHRSAAAWLFLCSLFFYGYWMPQFTALLLASICGNYYIGVRISRASSPGVHLRRSARQWMIAGVAANLALLAYFKYSAFLADNINRIAGLTVDFGDVILPIGISFFTFTQIAFLADAYQKGIREYKFVHYGLFVTYFPHLIAGPVLHHAQMMPQFDRPETYRVDLANVCGGLAIFAIGLFKKVVLADGISPYADAIFDAADGGLRPTSVEAWLGALAYTLQLYFDFSGYSDMAVGLSWMFNVCLPFNFDSPYKAASIVDFWRRWHITLSNFLRDYLYIPLGGNRLGALRRQINLMTTMLLGGLWHGASWTFVAWGGLHGAYLVVNHLYRAALPSAFRDRLDASRAYAVLGWSLTLLSVIVAWVFFRAVSFDGAARMLDGMFLGEIFGLEASSTILWNAGLDPRTGLTWCAVLGALAALAPNSNVIGIKTLAVVHERAWVRDLLTGAAATLILLLVLLNTARDAVSAFIYFNF
jgi:alginate O-acetyltransferase complex protein AlgI